MSDSDTIRELRKWVTEGHLPSPGWFGIDRETAVRFLAADAENERLREALERIVALSEWGESKRPTTLRTALNAAIEIARDAAAVPEERG